MLLEIELSEAIFAEFIVSPFLYYAMSSFHHAVYYFPYLHQFELTAQNKLNSICSKTLFVFVLGYCLIWWYCQYSQDSKFLIHAWAQHGFPLTSRNSIFVSKFLHFIWIKSTPCSCSQLRYALGNSIFDNTKNFAEKKFHLAIIVLILT